jgi:hypothetical protein
VTRELCVFVPHCAFALLGFHFQSLLQLTFESLLNFRCTSSQCSRASWYNELSFEIFAGNLVAHRVQVHCTKFLSEIEIHSVPFEQCQR